MVVIVNAKRTLYVIVEKNDKKYFNLAPSKNTYTHNIIISYRQMHHSRVVFLKVCYINFINAHYHDKIHHTGREKETAELFLSQES